MTKAEKAGYVLLAFIISALIFLFSPGVNWPTEGKQDLNDYVICTGHDCIGPKD